MERFALIRNVTNEETAVVAASIIDYLHERGCLCTVSDEETDVPDSTQCVIVLGGDGTLLRAAQKIFRREIPIIGINMGTIGYLAEVERRNMKDAIDRLISGDFSIEERMMLRGKIIRADQEIYSDVALNDIVISRSKPLRGLRYVNSVNGKYLNTYAADGIIVATATGSTGYNLSVGGPIVSPEAQILLLTPIAAHSLISRSIVLPGTDQISIEIAEGKMGALEEAVRVSFDGGSPIALNIGDRVTIRRSKWHTRLVKMKNTSFLETLRYKMREA